MTGFSFDLHKFVGLIKKGVVSGTNPLDERSIDESNNLCFPEYKNYNQLKDLLRNGEKDKAKSYIEKGFPLNKDCADNTYDGTPLHLAVSLEFPDIVELLLEKEARLDSRNDSNDTPLMLAAIVGNSQIIDTILSKTKAENCFNDYGFSHFHIACMQNRVELVQKFLISGVDVNKPIDKNSFFWPGFTALHFAVEFRSIETAKLLIDNQADITIQGSRGLTPLHLAFRKRNRLLTDLLLSKQYYYASNPIDSNGLSHFHIACAFNKKEVVEDFLDKKVDVKHIITYQNLPTWYGYGGFHFAMQNQCIDVLEYLLKCDTKEVGKIETHVIDYAYETRNLKIVNLIISSMEKAIVNAECSTLIVNLSNDDKVNPSVTDKSISAMEKLGHLKRFYVSQYTELHVAVLQKNKEQINAILNEHHPSIITVTDARGKTPLHLAFETNQNDVVEQLLIRHLELDENPMDSNNISHFHISCTSNKDAIAEDFIMKGVDVNTPINLYSSIWAGDAPLHLAIKHNRTKVVKLLLGNGADFTLKNSVGISPYDLAMPELSGLGIVGDDGQFYSAWDSIGHILAAQERRKIDNFEDYGLTLLHVASAKGDIDMIRRCANADTINKTVTNNLNQWFGFTPLHLAAFLDRRNAMKVLLDLGADPAIQNCFKSVPAHHICDNVDDRLFLIPKIVNNEEGVSIFHVACQHGNLKAVQHFLKMGADVNKRIPHGCYHIKNNDEEGQTPLHLAVSADHPEIVKLLLEHGADVNARDCYFNTPLHFCTNKKVLKILLKYGADPEALNCELLTAMENAIYYCSEPDFINAAIDNGWDINKGRLDLKRKLEPSNYTVLARHLVRLRVLGVNLTDQNKMTYSRIASNDLAISYASSKYSKRCASELKSMTETEIDSHTTLYDIIFKSSNEMAKYSNNETLQEIFEWQSIFQKTYPIYAYLVILQIKKGIRRTSLLEQGKKSLSILMNQWMSDLVFEIILQFMDDHEITYLNYAATGRNIFH